MPTLRPDERKSLERLGGEVLFSTAAKVYHANNPKEYAPLGVGALCFVKKNNYGFVLVDIKKMSILWEESFSKVRYFRDRPYFHSFVGSTCMIGFSFADEAEGNLFASKVESICAVQTTPVMQRDQNRFQPPVRSEPPQPPSRMEPPAFHRNESSREMQKSESPQPRIIEPPARTASAEQPAPFKKSQSVDSMKTSEWFGMGRSKSKKEKKKIDKSMISAPSDFQHISHVGYDPKKGFSARDIPMEWKVIFAKAGITEEQLQDRKTAKIVHKFMKQHGGPPKESPKPQAPSPNSSRRAPPPPPARTSQTSRAPPPAPPSRQPTVKAPPPIPSQPSAPSPPQPRYQPAPSQPPAPNRPPARTAPPVPNRAPPPMPARDSPPVPTIPHREVRESPREPPREIPAAPPAPPMPPVGTIPPPPPMPTMTKPNAPPVPLPPSQPHVSSQAFEQKKPALPVGNTDLLASIRQGITLRSTSTDQLSTPPNESSEGGDDLADALRNALKKRVNAVAGSDEDSDEDSDDSDW